MFCPNCGGELPSDANYCPMCNTVIKPSHSITLGRPGVITAASILSGIMGGCSIIGAIACFLTAGVVRSETPNTPEQLLGMMVTLELMIAIGVVLLIFGVLCLLSCNRLWKCRRSGGILGIALGVLGIVISVPLSIGSAIGIIPSIALIVLILMGWRSLN